jgi:putative IMPACT (imprinted ancient) family translation regulator
MLVMELKNSQNLYLMMMYVYLKAYREALTDFEVAVKDSNYLDMALMSVQQKYKEKIERFEREMM